MATTRTRKTTRTTKKKKQEENSDGFIKFEDVQDASLLYSSPEPATITETDETGNRNYILEDIASVEKLPDFDNEFVYDIEVDDTHMFIANDILVHNSIYVEFGRVCNWLKVPQEERPKFVVDLWNYAVGPFMQQKYEEYAKDYNCDKNIQNLELEKISDITMYFAKKRYAMSECWKEPNIFLPKLSKIIYKGIEIVKGSTPSYARECMEDFVHFVIGWYAENMENQNAKLPMEQIIKKLKHYKSVFIMKSPDDICAASSVGDYEKYILSDTNKLIIGDKCPAHIKACGTYNYLLNRPKNKKYKVKYSKIQSKQTVRWYYCKDKELEVFAYLPGSYPAEFAPPIDMDTQFEKVLLAFLNKIVSDVLGYPPLTANLCYTTALF